MRPFASGIKLKKDKKQQQVGEELVADELTMKIYVVDEDGESEVEDDVLADREILIDCCWAGCSTTTTSQARSDLHPPSQSSFSHFSMLPSVATVDYSSTLGH
jgi:hypothetical protein